MTMIIMCTAIVIGGACEEVCKYYGFNLEKRIRKMQDKSAFFS